MEEIEKIATIGIKIGEQSVGWDVLENDAVLLFAFKDGSVEPSPLMIGNTTAAGFINVALSALKIVSDAIHEELDNGQEEQDSR